MTPMETTTVTVMKELPQFSAARCKRCGICSHFCPVRAIDPCDGGMPILADPVACTSCGLCRDMCPDWAISLEPTAMETPEAETGAQETGTEGAEGEAPAADAQNSGNGPGSLEAMPASGD